MRAAAAFRGQPLLVLVGLLGAWLALRVAFWQPGADAALLAMPDLAETPADWRGEQAGRRWTRSPDPAQAASARRVPVSAQHDPRVSAPPLPMLALRWIVATRLPASLAALDPAARAPAQSAQGRLAVGHTLLLAAGLAQAQLPPALAAYFGDLQPQAPGVPAAAPLIASLPQHAPAYAGSRWSADAWTMLRQDTTAPVASGRPSYGRSQAGAVLRYRLAPSSGHAPQAYLRASSALTGALERDLVAGLSGRPLARVPLRVALEARFTETGRGTELRPAAVAVTELPQLDLPRGLRAEAYLQGGFVGGRFATAFIDGQGRVERPVARVGEADVSAGAGAWGGAQEGAARLDIGPTAAVSFRIGEARGRVAADYRIRLAGDAEPKSGPALTLSAGF